MKQAPDFLAHVAMLASTEGGRQGPTPAGWFRCIMVVAGTNYDVRLKTERPLVPGEEAVVEVYFLDPETAMSRIRPGTSFVLREAMTIARGLILQPHEVHVLS